MRYVEVAVAPDALSEAKGFGLAHKDADDGRRVPGGV
jgi:hypothetical protein